MQGSAVGSVLRARARAHPDKLFLSCGNEQLSFSAADARSDRVAAGLAELGVAPGDRVAILSANRPEMLDAIFACAKLGAIQVPLNAFLKGEWLRYQLNDAEATTLIADGPGVDAAAEVLSDVPALKRIIAFEEPPASPLGPEMVAFDRLISSSASVPSVDVSASDLVSILYTSGTTGFPKGCMMSHAYYLNMAGATRDFAGLSEEDVVFAPLPLFHASAQITVVLAALVHGLTAVIESSFHPATLLERLIETQATTLVGVGMMGAAMLQLPESETDRAHKLRLAVFVPFPPEMEEQFRARFGVPVLSKAYGQTESNPISYGRFGGSERPGSVGSPAPYFDVRVVDDDDEPVAVGEVGEIVVRPRGPHVMFSGYWRKPEETLRAWRNLWHHTGDYGRLDEEGLLYFVDRKKDALRRRGENISSMELEAAILRHPKIAEAAVHAVPSNLTEDEVKACIVLAPGETVEPEELFGFFKETMPYFAVPRYVEVLTELPRNATMRVRKHLLRERGVTAQTWDFEAMGLSIPSADRR